MHDKIIVQMTEAEHAAFCIIQEHAVEFNNIERELNEFRVKARMNTAHEFDDLLEAARYLTFTGLAEHRQMFRECKADARRDER